MNKRVNLLISDSNNIDNKLEIYLFRILDSIFDKATTICSENFYKSNLPNTSTNDETMISLNPYFYNVHNLQMVIKSINITSNTFKKVLSNEETISSVYDIYMKTNREAFIYECKCNDIKAEYEEFKTNFSSRFQLRKSVLFQFRKKKSIYIKLNEDKIKQKLFLFDDKLKEVLFEKTSIEREINCAIEELSKILMSLRKANIAEEKKLKWIVRRIVAELILYINFYDVKMSILNENLKDLLAQKTDNEAHLKILQTTFLEVDKNFLQMKEEENKQKQRKKILYFVFNRSAIVIQRYWKKFVEGKKKSKQK